MIGAQYGRGALRVEGRTIGYFATLGGSFGAQIGAQSRAIVYAFMTRSSLDRFKRSSGWRVGADATVALVKMGANGKIDTSTAVNPIEAFVRLALYQPHLLTAKLRPLNDTFSFDARSAGIPGNAMPLCASRSRTERTS